MLGEAEHGVQDASHRATVLIVDDDPTALTNLSAYLEQAGLRTLAATNGAAALKQSRQRRPDLIVLNVLLPDMDGREVCQRLKAGTATRDVPVIVLTTAFETEALVKAFQAGAVEYITKPFQYEEVLRRVSTQLENNVQQTRP
jgi:DNA-binding response OmpR family regulator